MKIIYALIVLFLLTSCYSHKLQDFKTEDQPAAPDYSNENNWSALPFRNDAGDFTRKGETPVSDSVKDVDVFYIYPTLYKKGDTWNADLSNKKLNKDLDNLPVKFHTAIFNRVARIYAPRYRQAILESFFDTTGNGKKALDFAYEDVKRAFEYYMKHYNNGRPIILVSHSQGTMHARRLLKDEFDTPEMKKKLVCAYVVGFGIYPENYKILKPCDDAAETNCYVTWSSFKEGYTPKKDMMLIGKTCVNPVSWKMDTVAATASCGVFLNMNKKKKFTSTAAIHNNYLWVKTNMPIMRHIHIMHFIDFNLFWYNIRDNATLRVNEYLKNNK